MSFNLEIGENNILTLCVEKWNKKIKKEDNKIILKIYNFYFLLKDYIEKFEDFGMYVKFIYEAEKIEMIYE